MLSKRNRTCYDTKEKFIVNRKTSAEQQRSRHNIWKNTPPIEKTSIENHSVERKNKW